MLRFTEAGAVESPTTLQVRLTRLYADRVRAGAPVPERSLDDDELRTNLRHFTLGLSGPRSRPCTALVLSGARLQARPGLAGVLSQGREWGIERVTLHLGRGERDQLVGAPLLDLVDAVSLSVGGAPDAADVAILREAGLFVSATLLLSEEHLPRLPELARELAASRPHRVVLTWPFPPARPLPPPAARAVAALPEVVRILDESGVVTGIKGLPVCVLGALGSRLWRSANRWYVDAEHQGAEALLFFPGVMRFSKVEECRFCAADERCDGVPEDWLSRGLAGRLTPV